MGGRNEIKHKQFTFMLAALVLVSYCAYLPSHMSIDSWGVAISYADMDAMDAGHLRAVWSEAVFAGFSAGRFARATLFLLFALLHKASWLQMPWVNAVAVMFMALSGCKMLQMVLKTDDENYSMIVKFLCIAIAVCNPFFTDWMQYYEAQLYYPLGLYLAILAAERLFLEESWRTKNWALASLLLTIAGGLYQITLQYFVLLAVVMAIQILFRRTAAKDNYVLFWKKLFSAVSVYAVAAAVQFLFIKVFGGQRIHSNSFQEIMASLLQVQAPLWKMVPYTGNKWTGLFAIAVGALMLRALIEIWSREEPVGCRVRKTMLVFIAFAGFYTALFLPLVVSELWFPQRSLVGFWAIPLIFAVAGNEGREHEKNKKVLQFVSKICIAVCTVLLMANIYNCQQFASGLYKTNGFDMMRGKWIYQVIEKYERQTERRVEKVAFIQDDIPTYTYPNVVSNHENNQAAWSASWNCKAILEMASGRNFQEVEYPRELFESWYDVRNWDGPEEEQIFFDGDTAYVVIY